MNKTVEMQPWITLFQTPGGDEEVTEVLQNAEQWLDTSGHELAVVGANILDFTPTSGTVSLLLEATDELEGQAWKTVEAFTQATSTTIKMLSDAPTDYKYRLRRWLRWRIDNPESDSVAWQTTFAVTAMLKNRR